MVDGSSVTLLLTAVGVAVLHTAVGPDHYVPFVALAHARRWSRERLLWITAICGAGHVLASLLLGAALVLVGASLGLLERFEESRGSLAAWGLVVFGVAYALWGARLARRGQRKGGHHARARLAHRANGTDGTRHDSTSWTLFALFVLGPCEPLIPLVFLPAAGGRWALAGLTAALFGAATVTTMVVLVAAARAGTRRLSLGVLGRWPHSTAGGLLALSGVAMRIGL